MTNFGSTTRTRALSTTTRREIQKAIRAADLRREEELVLRMRYGIGEPNAARLQFVGQDDPEISAKLALIESEALARVRPRTRGPQALEGEELKAAIIEKLKEL